MHRIAAFVLSVLLATSVAAQDRPNTILVMDGSGSMWGQIDGVAKITIAQGVVRDLLQTIPETESLGLTVYGHRQRGDCADIQTIVAPGPNTRAAIAQAVDGIKPLGKTPMTDAVIAAAEALRYTEDSATVILVSDGVETCNPDPCAAARLLEQAGIDFTAHVIGFDVGSDAAALAQMQCIAAETGGMFIPAANASELAEALNTIVEEPEPVIIPGTFRAVLGDENGPLIDEPIMWDITGESGMLADDMLANPLMLDLTTGSYQVTAYRLIDEVEMQAELIVSGSDPVTLNVPFPAIMPTAALDAPETAPAGSTLMVGWTGPDAESDTIQIAVIGGSHVDYAYTRDGNPAALIMPAQPGAYELRYVLNDRETIATRAITATPVPLSLTAPDSVVAGSDFTVTWEGPDQAGDNVQIAEIGGSYQSYAYTKDGNPATLTAPAAPGEYELRYVFRDRETLLTRPISVTEVAAGLTAPDTAQIGATIMVGWDGPNYERDYVAVGLPGEQYINYTYTKEGNPLGLQMPTEPGTYEIRYQLAQGGEVISSRMIEVTDVKPQLTAPATAFAGETVSVAWEGPDYDRDFISVGLPGQPYATYTYTREGNPAAVKMPTEPGEYEIRYQLGQGSTIVANIPISVSAVQASVTAPAEAVAGSTVQVDWIGPDYDRDYISIGLPGEDYSNYTYTKEGQPADLLIPVEPGNYEIRYQMGQGGGIIANTPITITPVKAQLVAPASVAAGTALPVGWDGPDYAGDYIGIGKVGEEGYVTYTYTREGNPVMLKTPDAAGAYEVRYYLGQGGKVIASQPLTVE